MIPEAILREVEQNLQTLLARIEASCSRAGRPARDVHLLAVSKRQPIERIAAAVVAGARDLGENYVQEARDKREAVEALVRAHGAPLPRWHLIGSLQRNKAKVALEIFDRIETVDRSALAEALARRVDPARAPVEVLLQVNVSRDPRKAGVAPGDAAALLEACSELPNLSVRGLMTIPAAHHDPTALRADFRALRALRDTLRTGPGGAELSDLSMGMSADFELAIDEGATSIRIGTAVFGARPDARSGAADPEDPHNPHDDLETAR